MTVDSKDGTVVRGADGALYVVSTDICQRAAQALNTGFGSGNTSTGTLRFAKSKDHASARAFVDPGDHASARAFVDPGDHASARAFVDPGDHDHASARAFVDPGDLVA
jgi:hypothetical protein